MNAKRPPLISIICNKSKLNEQHRVTNRALCHPGDVLVMPTKSGDKKMSSRIQQNNALVADDRLIYVLHDHAAYNSAVSRYHSLCIRQLTLRTQTARSPNRSRSDVYLQLASPGSIVRCTRGERQILSSIHRARKLRLYPSVSTHLSSQPQEHLHSRDERQTRSQFTWMTRQ